MPFYRRRFCTYSCKNRGEGDPFAPVPPPAQMYVYLTGRSEVVHQLLCGVGVAEDDSCFVKISWFNTRDEYHYFHVMNLAAFSNLESHQNFIFDCEYALAVQGFFFAMLLVVWVYLTNKIQLHKVVLGQRRSNLAFASDWSYFGRQQDKSCVVIFCGFSNVSQIFTEEFQIGN